VAPAGPERVAPEPQPDEEHPPAMGGLFDQ